MREAGPELIRERPETKEEASKRKDVWQKTGKGAYSKTTKGVIWNETQRSWNEKVWPQAEEAGPKLETERAGCKIKGRVENERERSLL